MSSAVPFESVGRLPAPGDNVAIAVRTLDSGTTISYGDSRFTLPLTVLEGHRFAVVPIRQETPLLSWGLPFGVALRAIVPGEYVCNEKILRALKQRHVPFPLPDAPNFHDYYVPFRLDESQFRSGRQVERYQTPATFSGYGRGGGRGAGTRNYIAILGTTSRTGSYARALADRFKDVPRHFPNIDGIVPIAHTEAASESRPNNIDFVLRTLAGFVVHPNIAAVLAVDLGLEYINNDRLREFMVQSGYALDHVLHQFWTMRGNFLPALEHGAKIVRGWLDQVNAFPRTPQPLEDLRIGLQCGGSDAFSGVSGNPLVGCVSKEVVRHGGSANLAETDELIGAEPYILANIKDLPTARAFLNTITRFQERAGWHGHTGEGNPSGGNNFRGLYNIAVKSIGAARKKDPEVCVDYVIEYAQPMRAPGFYFMDSPGNDLESIAGQVGSGCNLILFTTGNGSITNFPFVPTIKVMTNTGRFNLLSHEMDVNAGRYLDGTPMNDLARETFDLTLSIASGERSAGEKAGHSQVQLWRDWRQTDTTRLKELRSSPKPSGEPVCVSPQRGENQHDGDVEFEMLVTKEGAASDQVGLIVPTSLCAGQIGQMIADKLNRAKEASPPPFNEERGEAVAAGSHFLSRYVALAHTEGCGVSSGESEEISLRTMASYLSHPLVGRGLLLEHGCEKTHNDAMHEFMEAHGLDFSRFGKASIQLDGGIENVTDKVTRWFQSADGPRPRRIRANLASVRLGLTVDAGTPDPLAAACASLAARIVGWGGTVVVPENSPLLNTSAFKALFANGIIPPATLAYGEKFLKNGFHIMQAPTNHAVETVTGLGATGVEVILICVSRVSWQSHPLVPVLQVSTEASSDDLDVIVEKGGAVDSKTSGSSVASCLLDSVIAVLTHRYMPKLFKEGNTDFQMTRGELGVSL
jgi:altronate dehydratase